MAISHRFPSGICSETTADAVFNDTVTLVMADFFAAEQVIPGALSRVVYGPIQLERKTKQTDNTAFNKICF